MISSTAGDKAKYKQTLVDWVVAFCLLFFMHYIMAATLTIVEKVNTVIGKQSGVQDGITLPRDFSPVYYNPKDEYEGERKYINW